MRFSNRFELIWILGGKCSRCPQENMSELEIDHIYNDGDQDRSNFNNVYKKWLAMPELAKKRLQVLCKTCHEEKGQEERDKEYEKLRSQFPHREPPNLDKPKYILTQRLINNINYIVHRETDAIPYKLKCKCGSGDFCIYTLPEQSFLFCYRCEFTQLIIIQKPKELVERLETN